MMRLLQVHMPNLLQEARAVLEQEEGLLGILNEDKKSESSSGTILPYEVVVPR